MQDSRENPLASTTLSSRTTAARLTWLPIPIAHAKAWTSGLADYEAGWFWNLIFNSLAAEPQGYLFNSSNFWTIAGARRSDFWANHKSRVLARFEVREVDGIQMLYFPPLVEIINQQSRKLHRPRASLSSLDPNNQNQNQREREPRAKTEERHDHRATQKPTGPDWIDP